MIELIGREISVPESEYKIGFMGDNKVSERTFKITDSTLFSSNFKLDIEYASGQKNVVDLIKEVTSEAVILTWEITKEQLTTSGVIKVQIRTLENIDEKIWHSSSANFYIIESINATDSFPSVLPSEFTQMEARVTDMKNIVVEKAEELNTILGDVDTALTAIESTLTAILGV